jgi:gas vesicle protein
MRMNSLLVGAVAGLVAGLLLAPQTGKESREIVKERFNSVRDMLMKMRSTNGEGSEEGLESSVRADYLH